MANHDLALRNPSVSIPAIAVYSLTAFIPKDIVITVLAVLIAIPIRKGINNAGNR